MARQSIAAQLEQAQRILDVAEEDAEVRERLAEVGYSGVALAQGRELYAAAQAARTRRYTDLGDQLRATNELKQLQAQVRRNVGGLSRVARAIFKDDATRERLGLRQDRRAVPRRRVANSPESDETPSKRRQQPDQSLGALLDRARVLYGAIAADPALQQAFAEVGYTAARIAAERALVTELEQIDAQQEHAKAEAKAAVVAQQEALAALGEWMGRFKVIARVLLRDRPDLLHKLGL